MRFLFLFIVLFVGIQNTQAQKTFINPDTTGVFWGDSLNIPKLQPPTMFNDDEVLAMPVYNPKDVDAKILYWWPSTHYLYNMPNAYKGEKPHAFALSGKNKEPEKNR